MKYMLLFVLIVLNAGHSFPQSNNDTSITYIHSGQSFKGSIAKLIIRAGGKHGLAKSFKNNDFDSTGAAIPESFYNEFTVEKTEIAGKPVYTLSPRGTSSDRYILYIHGGAYVRNMVKQHWQLIGELIRKTNYTVVVPDYPLAPANTVETAFPMVEKVYKSLLGKTKSSNIVLMGDSAGGGFALALAQKLKKDKVAQPEQIILLSPWLDVTMSNPQLKELEAGDPMLDIEGSQMAGKAYAGKMDTKNYLVSPIYGDLSGLAKISVFTGGKDMLIADAERFKNLLNEKGIPMNYFVYPKMFHVWIAATFLKESKIAIDQIAGLLK